MPDFDHRLKRELEGAALPGDPSGAMGEVERKRSRRRSVRRMQIAALAVVVVAGSAAGAWGLTRVFGGGSGRTLPGGSATPSTPSASAPEPTPTFSPTEAGPVAIPSGACAVSLKAGNFDGDGQGDRVGVYYLPAAGGACDPDGQPTDHGWTMAVTWSGGASASIAVPECRETCVAQAASDVNGDGQDELFVDAHAGASTEFLVVYELPVTEKPPTASTVAPPGVTGFDADQPAEFPDGGSVTHQDFITCDIGDGGTKVLIATGQVLSTDRTEWSVTETVLTFDGERFNVVSQNTSTAPAAQVHLPTGQPCW